MQMKKFITLIILVVYGANSFAQESSIITAGPAWYSESLIHTHHSAGLPAPEWEVQFDRVQPDAVQFHTQAYAAGKELSAKYNFSFVATRTLSGAWDDIRSIVEALPAEEQSLFYIRVNPDGSPAGRTRAGVIVKHVCFYSPGIYKYIIPEYGKLTEQYQPAQIWIDHTIVTVNLCYCDNCKKNFRERYSVDPPENGGDLLWNEWVYYHRKGFELWMKAVSDIVQSKNPDVLVTFNGAYQIAQPEPPPPYIKNLSLDAHSLPMNLCLYARYASSLDVPFDLMNGLTDTWAGTIPKSTQEVMESAAIITANGGRWNIGEFPMSKTQQPADEMLLLAAAGADMVRERQDWIQNTRAVPMVAVLHSASTQYSRVIPSSQYVTSSPGPTRLYWYNNLGIPNEIYGAGAALLENNIPFDIINESTLKKRLDDYQVLIVGEQFRLDTETLSAVRGFVERGGGLLVTGRTIETGLAGFLGVSISSGVPLSGANIRLGGTDIPAQAPIRIETKGAKVVQNFSSGATTPAITQHVSGKGNMLYVACDFFKMYMDVSSYNPKALSRNGNAAMRSAVADWIKDIAPNLGYSCTAPPWIEIALRRKNSDILVQLVDRSFEWYGDLYSISAPIHLKLSLKSRPDKVLLQPGNREIIWEWQDDTLTAAIPINEVRTHSVLEIKGVTKYNISYNTISNIPFGSRIDTLFWYLGKDPAADWKIIFVDGVQRPDLKNGDKLIITDADNSTREYFLRVNDYIKSANARLSAIKINGDTLNGFKSNVFNYKVMLPKGSTFPVISAFPENMNAKVRIGRALNLKGGEDQRTARIYVTAENELTESLYSVTFEILKKEESFRADPFFSQIMNGLYNLVPGSTSVSGWGKGWEIFNPGNTTISMGNYLIVNATAGTLASVIASKDMISKMRPGFTMDSSRIDEGIYYKACPYPFNTDLEPGQTLVFGRGFPDGWNTTNGFRDFCDFRDTNGDLVYALNKYGFVDGARICFFGVSNSIYLIRIDNDSILTGLKSANDLKDFTLVDIFGAQGENNNRIIDGVFVSDMSATILERKKEIWKGNSENFGSFGTGTPGTSEWDRYQGAMYIGTHPYDQYKGYISTVYSLTYEVSPDFGPEQTIDFVPVETRVDSFLSRIIPGGIEEVLTVTNSDSSVVKTGSNIIVQGDRLNVVSGTKLNTTVYTITVQEPGHDALLKSSSYTINVAGVTGSVSGIPALTSIEEMLTKIIVPEDAVLNIIDVKNQRVETEKVLRDTLVVLKTMVSDSIKLEVIAQDGETKVLYSLVVTVDDPYVTSDFYLVRQENHLIDMFRVNTPVEIFLSRVIASTGSTLSVVDKAGNTRGSEGIMYKDDHLLVSDGIKTTIYSLKDMYEVISTDATLRYLKVNGITIEGFNPDTHTYFVLMDQSSGLPPLPVVAAAPNQANAKVTITQAVNLIGNNTEKTATISVVAEDEVSNILYSIIFNLNTIISDAKKEMLQIFSDGMTICIKTNTNGVNYEVEVFNITGRKIIQRKMTGPFDRFLVNESAGMYIVKAKSTNETKIQKIILSNK